MSQPTAILVFGEDDNDREAICELLRGLRPDAPRLVKRRKPLVLMKGRQEAAVKKNAQSIARQVERDRKRLRVVAVVAHQDADDVEPAHQPLAEAIERQLATPSTQVVGAVPAWETEAWLYLWPDAALQVCSSWRRPARTNQRVGLITDAKEAYRRDLRPTSQSRPPDYEASDCPRIVRAARELGALEQRDARSDSYERFRAKVLGLRL